jgi:hypothetical protein
MNMFVNLRTGRVLPTLRGVQLFQELQFTSANNSLLDGLQEMGDDDVDGAGGAGGLSAYDD